MPEAAARPWNPDRRWADPLLLLLLLFAVLSTLDALAARHRTPTAAQRPNLQARAAELQAAARELVPVPRATQVPEKLSPWDQAVFSVLLAEEGRTPEAAQQAEGSPETFRGLWRAAYAGEAPPPAPEVATALAPLHQGYAHDLLQARLAERRGEDPAPWRNQARRWAHSRLAALAVGGALVLGLVLTGLGTLGYLIFRPRRPEPPLDCPMPWRAAALAFLGWFAALRLSGTFAALVLWALPLPRVLGLPLALGFHTTVGAALLLLAEGATLREAWRRMTPGPLPRALAWAPAFLGVALTAVFAAGLIFQPLLRQSGPPQRELWELVSGTGGLPATLLLLATMAGLAPVFEEWMFRGALFPWLGHRLASRGLKAAWPLAVVLQGLLFGAMHLQPAGLPALCTLGAVLGWACLRTRNLWTAVAMHACWNGGVFLLMRALA